MTRSRLPLLAVLSLLGSLVVLPAVSATPAQAATPVAGQSSFVPVAPVRILDTRKGLQPQRIGPGGVLDLRVVDGTRVPQGATAVVLNVTVTGATAPTDVRVYPKPADASFPTVSNLNATPGQDVANLVTVKTSPDGVVRLRNNAGSVYLVADLSGYYRTGTSGMSTFVPRADGPVRLLDTRDAGDRALGPGEARPLDLRTARGGGASGVPSTASAVVLNVTATDATTATDVRVYPTRPGAAPPTVSNLNTGPGRITPNLVVVAVGDDASVTLRNASGGVHLVVDLAGWFVPGTTAAAFHPLDPYRALDTRRTGPAVGAGQWRDLVVSGAGRVPPSATAVVLNVTAVGPTATSDIRVYPSPAGGAVPLVSNLNVRPGQTVPNAVTVKLGRDGSIRLRNAAGSVHLVVDVAGWYGPTGRGWDVSWPQCTTAGSTTSRLPSGGAFSVVGLTRGVPFTDNECFAAQWQWASSLPGVPSVYINTNAPGNRGTRADVTEWQRVCGSGATTTCGYQYGVNLASYALARMPTTRDGGRPKVWLDVEGPYEPNGPFWQTPAVNRAVLTGVFDRLRGAGYRVGVYSDRGTVADPNNDWRNITGGWQLHQVQNWVFRAPDDRPELLCTPANSFSGGPVVMVQVQPGQSGVPYDVNHAC